MCLHVGLFLLGASREVMITAIGLLAQGNPNGGVSPLIQFAPFIIIGILFYMMLIRPERQKRAELEKMLGNLKKNDAVITVGGICGTVANAPPGSKYVTLKVDDSNNTRLRVLRSSISQIVSGEETGDTLES